MSTKAVLAQALQLPASERADIAKCLIASLDGPADDDVEASWLAEVERRLKDSEVGIGKFEDWESIRARIARRLREHRK